MKAEGESLAGLAELDKGAVGLVEVGACWTRSAQRPEPTADGGAAQLCALVAATGAARSGFARGLVTAPMSKAAVNLAGAAFTGHTEHLAQACGLADDAVTMMFLGPRLRVALATTHLAVSQLSEQLTRARVMRSIRHLGEALARLTPIAADGDPDSVRRVVVTGLNPHAGEAGLFGDEDAREIEPAVKHARSLAPFSDGGFELTGPCPAETAFRQAASGSVAGVVAMYHDQATIASKLLDWTQAVNVTWGLPFVRTSVDHGVAYDARQGDNIDSRGMVSALRMAQTLTEPAR